MIETHQLPATRSCRCVGLSRTSFYRRLNGRIADDTEVIEVLNALVKEFPRGGAWKLIKTLRLRGYGWNHKRILRVYRAMGLNQPRRTKKRLPTRDPMPLMVPDHSNQVWSADFMSDALYHGTRFRTFNVIDDFNREVIAIEIDTSLRSERLIRVFDRIRTERRLPDVLRVDNGPEFTGSIFTEWMKAHGVMIDYIQPGKPNQNAYIERFNRTYREEVLNLYLFNSLYQVREITDQWIRQYNEDRPHDALGGLPPMIYLQQHLENSTFELST